MKKTLVSIVVGTVLCMFMVIPVFANAIASDAFLERLEAEPKVQQPACDAFENLMEQIEGEDEYGFVYPEEYGGSYINEDNKLIIELTDLTEENIARYKRYCKSDGDVLEFVQADYSYNELQKCARDIFSQDIEHVVTTYVAEDKNKVIVGTDVADSDVMMKAINSETSMRMKGQKKTRVPIEVECVGSIERTANVIGGMGIKTTEAGATVGACGTYKGKPAVLTCGHGHPVKKWLNLSSGILGTVVKQQFGNKKNYDYSIVLIANNALKTTNYVYGSKKK